MTTTKATAKLTYESWIGKTGRVETVEVSSGQELADYVTGQTGQTGVWVRISMSRGDAEQLGLFRHGDGDQSLEMLPASGRPYPGIVVHELT